jgi:hypothetical protein
VSFSFRDISEKSMHLTSYFFQGFIFLHKQQNIKRQYCTNVCNFLVRSATYFKIYVGTPDFMSKQKSNKTKLSYNGLFFKIVCTVRPRTLAVKQVLYTNL